MPKKLIKRVAIAHSGVYTYLKEELPTLGLSLDSIPEMFKDETHFNVYRPAAVMAKAAPLFTRLPVTVEHPDRKVDPLNAKDLMEGLTGDVARVSYREGEAYIDSTLTLVAQDAINYYENGYKEVSPGYVTESRWVSEPTKYKGMPVHILITNIPEVNHLALVVAGRGGPTACVLDSKGDSMFKSRLLKSIHDLFTRDSVETIDTIMQPLGDKTITADRAGIIVDKVANLANAFPISEDKTELMTVLEDMRFAADIDKGEVKLAIDSISALFNKLDTAVKAETTDKKEIEMPEKTTTEAEPVKDYAPGTTGTAGPGAQKMVVGDSKDFITALKNLIKEYEGPTEDAKPLEGKETPAEEKLEAEKKESVKDAEPVKEPTKGSDTVKDAEPVKDVEPVKDSKSKEVIPSTSATLETTDSKSKGIDDFMKDLRS
jgi:hypothetical protein